MGSTATNSDSSFIKRPHSVFVWHRAKFLGEWIAVFHTFWSQFRSRENSKAFVLFAVLFVHFRKTNNLFPGNTTSPSFLFHSAWRDSCSTKNALLEFLLLFLPILPWVLQLILHCSPKVLSSCLFHPTRVICCQNDWHTFLYQSFSRGGRCFRWDGWSKFMSIETEKHRAHYREKTALANTPKIRHNGNDFLKYFCVISLPSSITNTRSHRLGEMCITGQKTPTGCWPWTLYRFLKSHKNVDRICLFAGR